MNVREIKIERGQGMSDRELTLQQAMRYYKTELAGGSLHGALDDGNLEDSMLWVCAQLATFEEDVAGLELVVCMLKLSIEEREWVYKQLHL